jgi:N-acetyl-anhydromuramyl-L-alanine amidase AmpD
MNINKSHRAQHLVPRKGAVPEFVVLHDTAGSGTVNDALYLAAPGDHRVVSVDFVALKTGEIYQLNPDPRTMFTYHAGRATQFDGYRNAQVNRHSIGIEISQKANIKSVPEPKYPHEQVQAVAELLVYFAKTFGIGKSKITTHSKIITDGSRSDPREFPWDELWDRYNDLAGFRNGGGKLTYTVQPGDTLWAISNKFLTSVEKLKALNDINDPSNDLLVGQTITVKE